MENVEEPDIDEYKLLLEKEPFKFESEKLVDRSKGKDKNNLELSESEKRIIDTIKEYIEREGQMWKENSFKDYKFNLPSTAFSEAKTLELISYPDAEVIYEDNDNEVLSDENYNDIATKGEFSMKSSNGKTYVWKISTWLIQGSINRKKNFLSDIGVVFEMFYYYKYRFNSKFKYANIYRVLKNFYFTVRDFFRLFIGTPAEYDRSSNINEKVYSDYYKKLIDEGLNTRIYFPFACQMINQINNEFSNKWSNESYLIKGRLLKEKLEEDVLKKKLLDERLDKLIEYLSNHEEFTELNSVEYTESLNLATKEEKEETINFIKKDNEIRIEMKKTLTEILKAVHIYKNIEADHLNKVDLMKKELMQNILSENPIRSKTKPWLNKTYFTEEKERILELEKEKLREINDKLKMYPLMLFILNSFYTFEIEKKALIKEIKENEKTESNPKKTFHYQYEYCTPKVEVIKSETTDQVNTYYTLKYDEVVTVSSDIYFWRIVSYYYFLLSMLWGVIIWTRNRLTHDPLSLFALFSFKLQTGINVNYYTGEISQNYNYNTYLSSFKNLGEWITESRENFLKNRHTNFFGSGFGNFINIIENYIIKAVILGFLLAIFYPIGILLYTIICLVIGMLLFFLSFVWIIIVFLFTILIYDLDNPGSRGCYIFPLIVWIICWRILICIGFSTLAFVVLMIVQLLTAIFMLLFGIFRYILRTIYDALTLMFIKCFAKVPKTDSSVAWKISGPGLNRNYFFKVSIDDALTIVRAKMEKLQLARYEEIISKKIDEPLNFYTKFSSKLNKVNCNITCPPKVSDCCSKVKNILHKQVQERRSIYPIENHSIRFNEEELEVFLIASQDLIKDYVQTNKMEYLWKSRSILKDSWNLLTESILIESFGSGIMDNVDDGSEISEAKQMDQFIIEQIKNVQAAANINNFSSLAHAKRKKLAERRDFDNVEDLELNQKYLHSRKHTSDYKYDDTGLRQASLSFVNSNSSDPFSICYYYIEKTLREKLIEEDKKYFSYDAQISIDNYSYNCEEDYGIVNKSLAIGMTTLKKAEKRDFALNLNIGNRRRKNI